MAAVTGVSSTPAGAPSQSFPVSPVTESAAAVGAEFNLPSIKLKVFQPTGRVYAEVLDSSTREVLKTVPPLEMLRVTEKLHHTLGLLFDRVG